MWEGVGDWTELQHIDPHSIGHNSVSFPFSWAAQLGAHSARCWFSLPHLISNWLNFLCTELYNSSTPTFFLWASQIALIQPIHSQGYNILIFLDRMHLLFTQMHFLFWQPGQVGGQYTMSSHSCHAIKFTFGLIHLWLLSTSLCLWVVVLFCITTVLLQCCLVWFRFMAYQPL